MKKPLLLVGILWAAHCAGSTTAQAAMTRTVKPLSDVTGAGSPFGYIEYKPPGYATPPANGWPLVLFLHGSGEAGSGNATDLVSVDRNALPRKMASATEQFELPAVVLCPQSTNSNGWDTAGIDTFVNYAFSHYNIDRNRLYVTGLSMGGGGTWNYVSEHMDKIAAAVPVVPPIPLGNGLSDAARNALGTQIVNQNLPIWTFVSINDNPTSANYSFNAIAHGHGVDYDSLNGAAIAWDQNHVMYSSDGLTHTAVWKGPTTKFSWALARQDYIDDSPTDYSLPSNPEQLWTMWPNYGHAWDPAYNDPKLYAWMFAQTLHKANGVPVTSTPPAALVSVDGSFEKPTLATNTHLYNPSSSPWTFTGNSGIVANGSPFNNKVAPEQLQAAFLQTFASQGAGNNGVITQPVTLESGAYNITLKAARRYNQQQTVKVSVGTDSLGWNDVKTFSPPSDDYGAVTSNEFTVNPNTWTLKLAGTATAGDVTAFVDDVRVNFLHGIGTGLTGRYYQDQYLTTFIRSQLDSTINFDWGGGSPIDKNTGIAMTSVGPDHFSVRWSGKVQAVESGFYTFTTTTDDGVNLWVNDRLLVNDWADHAPTSTSGVIYLNAGQKYNIRMDYYENTAGALAKLSWKRPNGTSEIVPTNQLYPTP